MDEALRLLPTDITVLGHDVRTPSSGKGSRLLLRPCPTTSFTAGAPVAGAGTDVLEREGA